MSRSYRKPWIVDGYGTKRKKYYKKLANRRIRRSKNVPDHNSYKKFTDQWDICDYKYCYDPHPSIHFWGGELHYYEPDPKWKAVRK